MEFNNAVRENTDHSLRHGSKKANMEKNQNPRIIPCKFCSILYISISILHDQKFIKEIIWQKVWLLIQQALWTRSCVLRIFKYTISYVVVKLVVVKLVAVKLVAVKMVAVNLVALW